MGRYEKEPRHDLLEIVEKVSVILASIATILNYIRQIIRD